MRGALGLLLLFALTAPIAGATTYVVRPDGLGDFPFIQDAINAAVNGDVIELADGIFNGPRNWNLDYLGKAITIRAQGGPGSVCIIDCWNMARGVSFHSGEGPQSRLEGVAILNGNSASLGYCGGGCFIQGSSPTISGCEFSYCYGPYGGGVYCQSGSLTLTNCVFRDNYGGGLYVSAYGSVLATDCTFEGNTSDRGAGARVDYGTATFTRCTFQGNWCHYAGAGIYSSDGSQTTLTGCTFVRNGSDSAPDGVVVASGGQVHLENTIVAFGSRAAGVRCNGGEVILSCCDVYGNEGGDCVGCIAGQCGLNGNISLDPQFCDAGGGDFTLESDSPCGPDYNPDCGLIGAFGIGCADAASVPEPPADGPPGTATSWGALKALFR